MISYLRGSTVNFSCSYFWHPIPSGRPNSGVWGLNKGICGKSILFRPTGLYFSIRQSRSLRPIRMIRNYYSSGQRCTHWHTLLIASSAGVLPQTVALTGVKHCILWIRSIGVDPTDRHQPQTRLVTILVIICFHILIYPDVTYGSWVKGHSKTPLSSW